jgi:hypothetical protein
MNTYFKYIWVLSFWLVFIYESSFAQTKPSGIDYVSEVLIVNPLCKNTQNDTSTSIKKLHHLFGVGFSYANYNNYETFKYSGEYDLNYHFIFQNFICHTAYGLAPATNFGKIQKFIISIGSTTSINRTASFHILLGYINVSTEHRSQNNQNYEAIGIVTRAGFIIKPFKKKTIFLNIDGTLHGNDYYYGTNKSSGITSCISLAVNYKL